MVAEPVAPALRFAVLGPVRGWREGHELDLGAGKQRAVLAVLLLHRNTPVPVSRIVDAVWGDEPPANGANVVQKYVAGLRGGLEPARAPRAPGQVLTLDDAGYTLAVGPDQLDLDTFERSRRSGLRHRAEGRPEQALRALRDAADLVGAEPLSGLPGAWFAAARTRLVDEWVDALEACVELEVSLGRHDRVLPEIRGLVARFPLRERLRAALMLALHRSGRPAEALAAFQAARHDLVEALGAEPGPALQDLNQRILRGDPSLDADDRVAGRPAGAPSGADVDTDVRTDDERPVATVTPLRPSLPSVPMPAVDAARGARPVRWILVAGAIVTPLVTLGLGSIVVSAVLAFRVPADRRRVRIRLFLGYCAVFVVGFALEVAAAPDSAPSAIGAALLLGSSALGAVQAAVMLLPRHEPAVR